MVNFVWNFSICKICLLRQIMNYRCVSPSLEVVFAISLILVYVTAYRQGTRRHRAQNKMVKQNIQILYSQQLQLFEHFLSTRKSISYKEDLKKVIFQVLQTMSFSGKNVKIGVYFLAKIYNCICRYFVLPHLLISVVKEIIDK